MSAPRRGGVRGRPTPHNIAVAASRISAFAKMEKQPWHYLSASSGRIVVDGEELGVVHIPLQHDVAPSAGVERDLFEALKAFPPLGLLVNETMGAAQPVAELGSRLFPDTPDIADSAATALLAVGSVAREQPDASGPLPCRVHNFYRGLPGLWVGDLNPARLTSGRSLVAAEGA